MGGKTLKGLQRWAMFWTLMCVACVVGLSLDVINDHTLAAMIDACVLFVSWRFWIRTGEEYVRLRDGI